VFSVKIRTGQLPNIGAEEECTNPTLQVAQATKFCTVAPNIFVLTLELASHPYSGV
jgi:hypothetical protein